MADPESAGKEPDQRRQPLHAEAGCHTPAVHLARRGLVAVLVLAVGACGGQPATGASGSLSATVSGSSGEGIQAFKDGLAAITMPSGESTDILRDRLIAAFDLRGALGDRANAILALVGEADDAAYANLPKLALPTSGARPIGGVVLADYLAEVPVPPKAPPPTTELMITLPGALDAVGRPGASSAHSGPDSATATAKGDGLTATSVLSTTIDVAISGSVVTLTIIREIHSIVAEDATGAIGLDASEKYTVLGRIDVCPSTAGLSVGRLEQAITIDATTKPGALGQVGTHSTGSITSSSDFRGQVDDSATLGGLTQDYTHDEQWRRTAAAEGGPEAKHEGAFGVSFTGIGAGAATEHDFSPTVGDFSKIGGSVHASGDATQQMLESAAIGAAWDFATIDQAFVAAQKLWRNSRCVVVAVPQYDAEDHIVESEIEVSLQGFTDHTEKVAKGSTTPFEVVLRHRFGQPVSATLQATLNGKDKLTPTSIAKPPGTLTYTAPSDQGEKASVRMTSTSKQGIGILAIAFDTDPAKGLIGTITLVENLENGDYVTKRHLTVHVRLLPRAGFDGVTGWFDDNGSTYEYEGSAKNHVGSSDPTCFSDMTWASTGSGSFGASGRSISLLIDQSKKEASLGISVQFATNYSISNTCFGETRTTTSSEPEDGWDPACGPMTSVYLDGTVGSTGSIDFACTVGALTGTGSLTVSGSLTRQ